MIKNALILAALFSATRALASDFSASVIYGEDNRRDFFMLDPGRARLAASTAAFFPRYGVRSENGWAYLPLQHFGQSEHLCPDEPFFDQPVGARCSGVLVAPDLVLTAAHCIPNQIACGGNAIVFDFAMLSPDAVPAAVPESSLYPCRELVDTQYGEGLDWSLIRLERPVHDRNPVDISWSGVIEEQAPLVVLGYPSGLPVKAADGASVREVYPPTYFRANLDSYDANSGSPVFNQATGLLEGILSRGETDFIMRGLCRASNRCHDNGCSGERVTMLTTILPRLHNEIQLPLFANR